MTDVSGTEYWPSSADDQQYSTDPCDPVQGEVWAPTVDTDGDGYADSFDYDVDPYATDGDQQT